MNSPTLFPPPAPVSIARPNYMQKIKAVLRGPRPIFNGGNPWNLGMMGFSKFHELPYENN